MAGTNGRVLIYGEAARARSWWPTPSTRSAARRAAVVEVNCAAIPRRADRERAVWGTSRAASQRHETKIGKFQKADGGTLFLTKWAI